MTELKKIGYKPISLKVVKAVPPPVAAHPTLTSKVPSLEITFAKHDDIEAQMVAGGGDLQFCTEVLHNRSSRGVVAYVLGDGVDPRIGVEGGSERANFRGHPVIAPNGDSRKELITFSRDAGTAPQRQQVVVVAAIFSDGSHEGDNKAAARLKGEEIGRLIINRLITPVIDRAVNDNSLNDNTRAARIKDELFHISIRPDQSTTRTIQAQFPDVPTDVLVKDLIHGLESARAGIWGDLYGYTHNCCQYPPPDHISLATWWQTTRHSIEPLQPSPG